MKLKKLSIRTSKATYSAIFYDDIIQLIRYGNDKLLKTYPIGTDVKDIIDDIREYDLNG